MKPTRPEKLKSAQRKARAKDMPGAPAGKWSARKAALARIAYEKQGGEWREHTKPEKTRRALDARRRRRKEVT